ncbi:arginine deiminase-related protein [Pedobacter sp. MC2016-14]|uniref:citrulline utilization hydrolase CtlX n=1 Tax=Pedobacter sp. MC2016-14 TaxID=2897327 RepID=UPI001E564D29|nr:arginine deiminase-related protein [Pedobacter sp. MC2016-14]MCD0489851.1 arginine deiminase-related protein [Pedobacter sp. MC2016-14]
MSAQTTNHILMIRPVDFKFNEQTAVNNKFQEASETANVQEQALKEFDGFVALLRTNEIDVTVIDDTLQPETPDSIFPNNWVSFHDNGEVFLYPMFSENRRKERRQDILEILNKDFTINKITDLSVYEAQDIFLEGTGSMVLDRDNKISYACLSLRTDVGILKDWCAKTGYTLLSFKADDVDGFPIYHTNVMMCIADRFAVICLESIQNIHEREMVMQYLIKSGKEIIEISLDQMNHFAGNMLQVKNKKGAPLLVMSEQAFLSLSKTQVYLLEKYNKLIYAALYTIEKNGGGSARCMLAENHLPLRVKSAVAEG